jgi:hypothetical protein
LNASFGTTYPQLTKNIHLNPQNYLLQTSHLYRTLVFETTITDKFKKG